MALDNSAYDSLQQSYFTIETYLNTTTLSPAHSSVIIKHEQLGEVLEAFDVEALEEQTKNVNALHEQLGSICKLADNINASIAQNDANTPSTVATSLDKIFEAIKNIEL